MSTHKKPLTRLERAGLEAHGLAIGAPSQLSDVFRHGVAWALEQTAPPAAGELEQVGAKALLFELVSRAPSNAAIKSVVEALGFFWRSGALPEMVEGDWPALCDLVAKRKYPPDGHYNAEEPIAPQPPGAE